MIPACNGKYCWQAEERWPSPPLTWEAIILLRWVTEATFIDLASGEYSVLHTRQCSPCKQRRVSPLLFMHKANRARRRESLPPVLVLPRSNRRLPAAPLSARRTRTILEVNFMCRAAFVLQEGALESSVAFFSPRPNANGGVPTLPEILTQPLTARVAVASQHLTTMRQACGQSQACFTLSRVYLVGRPARRNDKGTPCMCRQFFLF